MSGQCQPHVANTSKIQKAMFRSTLGSWLTGCKCQITSFKYLCDVVIDRGRVLPRPPFVFIDGTRRGNAAFYGFLVDLLPVLFQTAGLGNYTLEYYNSTNSGGERLQNGTWTGMPLLLD